MAGISTTAYLKPATRQKLEELANQWNCTLTQSLEWAIQAAWRIKFGEWDVRQMDAGEQSMARWCRECLVTAPGKKVRAHHHFYSAYVEWCAAEGVEAATLTRFGKRIQVKKETIRRRVFYCDVKLFGRAKAISRPHAVVDAIKEAA